MKSMPADSLAQYLDGLVEELRRQAPAAMQLLQTESIHKSRVATRRLKAALDLLEPLIDDGARRPFAKTTRRLRRRLGPLRDLDVMLIHLSEVRARGHAAAVAWVRTQLEQQRQDKRDKLAARDGVVRTLDKLSAWWNLRDRIVDAQPAIPALLAQSLHVQLDEFAGRAARICAADPSSTAPSMPQDPHELRIAGKRLRYTLELAAAQKHRIRASVFKLFKQMQDALGLWHDFVVLTQRILEISLEHELHLHDPVLQKQVLDLARFTLARSQRELAKFGNLWRDSGDAVRDAIEQTFPLTQDATAQTAAMDQITESQTDRDPFGSDGSEARPSPHEDAAPAA